MFKKALTSLSLVTLAFVFVVIPLDRSIAQDTTQTAAAGFVTCDGVDCSFCNLVEMANIIIIWLFGILFLIFAVIMFAAGFGLVTAGGNEVALDAAKKKFQNALIGIVIIMAAWLLIDTIMKGLLTDGQLKGWGPWSEVECKEQTVAVEYVREAANGDTTDRFPADGTVRPPATVSGTQSHNAALAELNANDITVVSSGSCSDKSNSKCTSLDGIKDNTIDRLVQLQDAVGVPLVLTGGTEAGHADGQYSHANGYKVDIRPTKALNDYITNPDNGFTKIGNNKYKDSNGNTYWRHPPDHWDITITN